MYGGYSGDSRNLIRKEQYQNSMSHNLIWLRENLNMNSYIFRPNCAAVSFRLTYENAWKIGTGTPWATATKNVKKPRGKKGQTSRK